MVAAKVIQPVTVDEFIAFALRPENADQNFELINGEIVPMSPSRTSTSEYSQIFTFAVRLFCRDHNLPCHTSGEAGAYLILGHVIVPDFAYKSTRMNDAYPDPEPPLLAVEVISPTDKAEDIRDKRNIYIEAGILLWEMYPRRREVDVYAPGQAMCTVTIDGVLYGGDVLPGFELSLKDLFAAVE
ncbi:MAG: Uma2 family endonuclease [Chloroflexota bacterium]